MQAQYNEAAGEVWEEPDAVPEPVRHSSAGVAVAVIALLLAVGWIAFIVLLVAPELARSVGGFTALAATVALGATPLALLAATYALFARGARVEARRLRLLLGGLRLEQARFEESLNAAAAQLAARGVEVAETQRQLVSAATETDARLDSATVALRDDLDALGRHAQALKLSTAAARGDLALLLGDLPRAHGQTRELAATIEGVARAADEGAARLVAQVGALAEGGRQADELSGGAAVALTSALERLGQASDATAASLDRTSGTLTGKVEATLDQANRASEAVRTSIDAQAAALDALVAQAEQRMARAGEQAGNAARGQVEALEERLRALDALLLSQGDSLRALLEGVAVDLLRAEERLGALDDAGQVRMERLRATLTSADQAVDALARRVQEPLGEERLEQVTALLSGARGEIEALAPTVGALAADASGAATSVDALGPRLAEVERQAAVALGQLQEAGAFIDQQHAALDAYAGAATRALQRGQDQVTGLRDAVEGTTSSLTALEAAAGGQLIEALLRVRDVGAQAAERAREAIAEVIPSSAEQLSVEARASLSRAVTEIVDGQMRELDAIVAQALTASRAASEQLTRQLVAVAETGATIEARAQAARDELAQTAERQFAKRVPLLIEALNSAAIDMTRVLDTEIADTAWQAYLKGDRGIFTRRSVRLLSGREARDTAQLYDRDGEFRAQVNRFVGDFEAMLREVLARRDGDALAVTLLSADIGKLYVALAQAIERLR